MTKHPQQHLFPFIAILLVVAGIAVVVSADINFSAELITVIAVIYFAANLIYGHLNKELSPLRVLELGIITVVVELIALQYLI